MKLYKKIVDKLESIKNCEKNANEHWKEIHERDLNELIDKLPHGSGINSDYSDIQFKKGILSFKNKYVVMNSNGFYTGQVINFKVVIKPNLLSYIDVNIIGNFGKYQDIKDLLFDTYINAMI
jgi:hypothetical protein